MYQVIKTERKGNKEITTELMDEGGHHKKWRCFLKGGWRLDRWCSEGRYFIYECNGCFALKRISVYRVVKK